MGLSTFWSNITGPRGVKEIIPQSSKHAFDRSRPATSAGVSSNRRFEDEINPFESVGRRPPTANGEKRASRLARSLSRSRKRSEGDLRNVKGAMSVKPDGEGKIPDIPPVPPSLTKQHSHSEHALSPETMIRPGTAITTKGRDSAQLLELPTVTTPIEQWIWPNEKPLPKVPDHITNRPSTTGTIDASRVSWSQISKIQPPLPSPPPTTPLPPIPVAATEQRELPRFERTQSEGRLLNPSDKTSSPRASRYESSNFSHDSVLQAFPPVPGLVSDSTSTPESSVPNSEAGDGTEHFGIGSPDRPAQKAREKKLPNPISVTDRFRTSIYNALRSPKSPSGTIDTPTSEHRQSPQLQYEEDIDVSCLDEDQRREWDSVSRFMELAEKQETNGVIRLLRSLEVDADRYRIASPSNEKALASLEFGPLK